jgi:diguanylate cyclase (GGDEF)-like protein
MQQNVIVPQLEQEEEPSTPASILVVDDSPTIARLLGMQLQAAGFNVRTARDGEEALAAAREVCPDLMLVDVMMPGMDGFELTRALRRDTRTTSTHIIVITGRGMSTDKLEGLASGADDYIVKPFDAAELLARIRGVLRRAKELRSQSPLTGLPGNSRIQEELERRLQAADQFAILHCDLDNFKAFNDHYGFSRGDDAIKMTSRLIQGISLALGGRETFVGHVGGDDFVVMAPSGLATEIADEILSRFDGEAPALYDVEDRERGYIEAPNRRGLVERYPMLAISIGIMCTGNRIHPYTHHAEAVAVATEMKEVAKRTTGSSWAIDRRRD